MRKGQARLRRLWGWLEREKGGATQYLALAMAAGFLLLTPIFLNFFSVHITRRVAQTGADAAALAAARAYSDVLRGRNPDKHGAPTVGACYEPESSVRSRAVADYLAFVYRKGRNRGIGYGWASQYARNNNTELAQFFPRMPSPSGKRTNVYGEWIPAVAVFAATRKDSPIMLSRIYGRNSASVPAKASAETYLEGYDYQPQAYPCGKDGVYYLVWITYDWRTRLIKDIR